MGFIQIILRQRRLEQGEYLLIHFVSRLSRLVIAHDSSLGLSVHSWMLSNIEHIIVCSRVSMCCLINSSFGAASWGSLVLFLGSLLNALLNVSKKLSCSVCNHSEEFTTAKPIISDSHTTVPNTDDNHDVGNIHLLKNSQQLVTTAILSKDFLLLDWISLADSVG
jgi:hypothetical protein